MTTIDKVAIMMGIDKLPDIAEGSTRMNWHLLWERARVIAEWHDEQINLDPTTRELRALSAADLQESNEIDRGRDD